MASKTDKNLGGSDVKIWRIHLKTDIGEGLTRQDLLQFCQENNLIGVGWSKIDTCRNTEEAIREQLTAFSEYEDKTTALKSLNAMRKMEVGDLIWTRLDSVYYLCKVIGLWENRSPDERHERFDICNYVNVKWERIGLEQNVPGHVISSFRSSAPVQAVYSVEDISMLIWNRNVHSSDYLIDKAKTDIWKNLSDQAIEEVVLLYLQYQYGYHIYSSTVKYSLPIYECEMVNNAGCHAFPQVKSGDVILDANDFMQAIYDDENADVFLFAVSEMYTKNSCCQIHYLYKDELESFMKEQSSLLPSLTHYWLELSGFFE